MRRLSIAALLATACAGTPRQGPADPSAVDATAQTQSTPAAARSPETDAQPSPATAIEPAPETPAPEPKVASVASAAEAFAKDGTIPALTEAQQAIFFGSAQDPPTEVRGGATQKLVGKHYVAGNEKTPQAFTAELTTPGGGYVGVGSDQAYLLVGWARPDVAWFIDYDADVVDVHAIHHAFITAADSPDAMLRLWSKEGRDDGREVLRAAYEGEQLERVLALYGHSRGWVHRRLGGLRKRLVRAKAPSFLDDQEDYDYVRQMIAARRIRPMLTNLLTGKGMEGIASSARELGVDIRVLYFSNAEEYWKVYPPEFRDHVAALPYADDALVLRTLLIWEVNQDYRYNVQPVANYLQWLAKDYVANVYDIVHARSAPDPTAINFFRTETAPEDSPAARKAAAP